VSFDRGDILLASLVFTSQAGAKRRPVMVVYDGGDDDLLVVPVTSHVGRTSFDVSVGQWQQAGLRLPSIVRVEKLATIEKSAIVRKLGRLHPADLVHVEGALHRFFQAILPK
jgi:mRNA interferase MazF